MTEFGNTLNGEIFYMKASRFFMTTGFFKKSVLCRKDYGRGRMVSELVMLIFQIEDIIHSVLSCEQEKLWNEIFLHNGIEKIKSFTPADYVEITKRLNEIDLKTQLYSVNYQKNRQSLQEQEIMWIHSLQKMYDESNESLNNVLNHSRKTEERTNLSEILEKLKTIVNNISEMETLEVKV